MVTSKHASWASDNPYSSQLDVPYVGPHALDVEWEGYDPRPTRADATVTTSTLSGLFSEIGSASAGDIIWLDVGDYNIDNNGTEDTNIPSDVTVASDGARIYTQNDHDGVFQPTNAGARLTGFRFEGSQETGSYDDIQSIGVLPKGNVQVDNCEFYRWRAMGMYVSAGPNGRAEPHIHHCIFRDNRTDSMGYGVAAYTNSDPLIEYCFGNNNRHAWAGNGADTTSYRLRNCLHGTEGMIFQSEMHAPGGQRMDLDHNEFRMVQRNNGGTDARAYAQRDTPADSATINNCWIHNPNPPSTQPTTAGDDAIVQYNHGSNDWVNVTFSNNKYGSGEPSDSSVGIQPLTDLNETAPTWTLDVTLQDSAGNPLSGTVDIRRIN